MLTEKPPGSPRERILATAMGLFYRQGFSATGVNQIISEAGVARASFYDHFPSKDDLIVAYAAEMARREIADIRVAVMKFPDARSRFFGLLDILVPWFEATDYRGCPFQNMMAEVSPDATRVHEVSLQHVESLRMFIRELALDLKNSDAAYARIDPEQLAGSYYLIFYGAVSVAVSVRQLWPVERAKQLIAAFLTLPPA